MVAVVGDLIQDIAVLLNEPIVNGGQVHARISLHRGGSAANVCSGLAAAGLRSRFYGRIGEDDVGQTLAAGLASEGVDVRARIAGSSCTVLCLVEPGGERSFVADAEHTVRRETIDVPVAELARADLLHVSGYWLFSGMELDWLHTVLGAQSHRRCLTVDLANVSRIDSYGPRNVRNLLSQLRPDVVFANHDEAESTDLLDDPPPTGLLVVTSGKEPTKALYQGEAVEVAVPAVENVVDTTGAGDAFVAGFLSAAVRGATVEGAVAVGHNEARQVIQVVGPR